MPTIPTLTLNNGVEMPQLGLGVWQASDADAEQAVATAIEAGYRLIDTAAIYANEGGVGRAISRSQVARQDLFITTKLWNADQGYDKALEAFDKSLERLGLDYVDLYLIHWPAPGINKYVESWQALEKLYADKRVRAIGVSNFLPEYLETLLESATVVPAINQVELHPYLQEQAVREACHTHDIQVESYSPIGGHKGNLLADSAIVDIAHRHSKSPAQVVLRWHIQNEFVVIPKSVHAERIRENADVFDFELSQEEMTALNALERGQRMGADPATANFT